MRLAAKACWKIDDNDWVLDVANLLAALLFVLGCLAVYSPRLYVPGVTLFLVGSGLMLCSGAADLYRKLGPPS